MDVILLKTYINGINNIEASNSPPNPNTNAQIPATIIAVRISASPKYVKAPMTIAPSIADIFAAAKFGNVLWSIDITRCLS